MTCTNPIVAMLAGVTPSASPCPHYQLRQAAPGSPRAGLGFALVPDPTDPAADPALEPDWHWMVTLAMAAVAIYAAWPKPKREARNVKRRQAAEAYRNTLDSINTRGRSR